LLNEGKHPMRTLNLKNVSVNLLRSVIVAVALIAWGGALAQITAGDHVKSGNTWFNKGDYDRAIADYNQALRINPQDAYAYNQRGVAWERKGDYDRAIADYTQALQINPQNTKAKENLAAVQRLAANSQAQKTSRVKEEVAKQVRPVAEAEAERKKQQELEQRLAAELKERERLRAETEAERKRRQELEEQLAKRDQERPPVPVAAAVPRNLNALAEHLNLF
jgi:tetratricopeptide (TPR) repeat protein